MLNCSICSVELTLFQAYELSGNEHICHACNARIDACCDALARTDSFGIRALEDNETVPVPLTTGAGAAELERQISWLVGGFERATGVHVRSLRLNERHVVELQVEQAS